MIKYLELHKKNQELFNEFANNHLFWIIAFSESKLIEELKKHDLKPEDVTSIGGGGFIRKSDVKLYNDLYKKMANVINEIKDNKKDLKDAFIYELGNHEYCITYDLDDTLDALNLTRKDLQNDPEMALLMNDAILEYLSACE